METKEGWARIRQVDLDKMVNQLRRSNELFFDIWASEQHNIAVKYATEGLTLTRHWKMR